MSLFWKKVKNKRFFLFVMFSFQAKGIFIFLSGVYFWSWNLLTHRPLWFATLTYDRWNRHLDIQYLPTTPSNTYGLLWHILGTSVTRTHPYAKACTHARIHTLSLLGSSFDGDSLTRLTQSCLEEALTHPSTHTQTHTHTHTHTHGCS